MSENIYCPQCGYNLRGLPDGDCPECGTGFSLDALRHAQQVPSVPRESIWLGAILLTSLLCALLLPVVALLGVLLSTMLAVAGAPDRVADWIGGSFVIATMLAGCAWCSVDLSRQTYRWNQIQRDGNQTTSRRALFTRFFLSLSGIVVGFTALAWWLFDLF